MPWSALPEHLNSPEKWTGTDDDKWWMRWRLKIKGWFAYGPRATEKWAKWREWPKTLFAIRSKQGAFRIETETWECDSSQEEKYSEWIIFNDEFKMEVSTSYPDMIVYDNAYLSRIQYYTRWHIQLQWPLFFACHFYLNKKLIYFYIGASRDADKCYWFPAFFLGRTWK